MSSDFAYLLLGFLTGSIGTLIGAGGGFLLTPVFIFLFPEMQPARLTAISLLAVSANSLSGSIGYALRKQVHWPSVVLFSVMAIPGVFIGVELSQNLPRRSFELFFACFMMALSGFVLIRSLKDRRQIKSEVHFWNRRNKIFGGVVSAFVGALSSLLGIGGGIVHVPLLSEFLHYPIHIAAGTSHAILALTSIAAVLNHLYDGDLNNFPSFVPYLVVGLIVGAQVGAALSKKVASHWILRVLGVALFLVSLRLISKNL